jgi:hypothetical protein
MWAPFPPNVVECGDRGSNFSFQLSEPQPFSTFLFLFSWEGCRETIGGPWPQYGGAREIQLQFGARGHCLFPEQAARTFLHSVNKMGNMPTAKGTRWVEVAGLPTLLSNVTPVQTARSRTVLGFNGI